VRAHFVDSNPKTGILCQNTHVFLDLHTLPVTVNILRQANDSEQQQEAIWQSEGARCILIQKLASYDKPSSSSGNALSSPLSISETSTFRLEQFTPSNSRKPFGKVRVHFVHSNPKSGILWQTLMFFWKCTLSPPPSKFETTMPI
jgi:hypothetical protein